MGLLKTQSQIAKLEAIILSQYSEMSEEQMEALELLENQIEKDRDNAFRLMQSKWGANLKKKINDRIDDLKAEIGKLENIEGAIENNLARFLEDKKYYEVKDDEGNTEFYVKHDMSIRKSIDVDKIEDELISYKYTVILDPIAANSFESLINEEGYNNFKLDKVYPTVTQLPEDHKAIVKKIVPKIKFVKNKPKSK